MTTTAPEYLTISELIERWRGEIKRSTLAVWRCKGRGPVFTKFGKRILYHRDSVIEFEQSKRGGKQC